MIDRTFLAHPRAVGESYLQHMGVASWFGMRMLQGACVCFVHAVVPGVFTHSGSRIVMALQARMGRRAAPDSVAAERADAASAMTYVI